MTIERAESALDPAYGDGGIAFIPGASDLHPERSLRVLSAAADSDGGLVFCGSSYADEGRLLFARMDAQGSFDNQLGHVEIPPVQQQPEPPVGLYEFHRLENAGPDKASGYLSASRPLHFSPMGHIYTGLAIGRYDEYLQPWPGFGDRGLHIVPPPPFPMAGPVQQGQKAERDAAGKSAHTQVISGLDLPRLALAGERIRVIYRSLLESPTGTLEKAQTWLALFDPRTGAPCKELGPEGDQAQVELPFIDQEVLTPRDAAFLDSGKVLFLGSNSRHVYLLRLNAHGEEDTRFADSQRIRLPLRGHYGLTVCGERIVVTNAAPALPQGSATIVHVYTLEGLPDPTFNGGAPLALRLDTVSSLQLKHVGVDASSRILLLGERATVASGQLSLTCHAIRLSPEGVIDTGFAQNGHFQHDDFSTGDGLYLHDDGLRLLAMTKRGDYAVLKVLQ